jgi:uncharacterized RDD family membrane protein YckC
MSTPEGTPDERPNTWAVVALALAVVAFLLGLMPGIGFLIAIPMGAVATLLAFPALGAAERTGRGRAMAWSAFVLALLAMFVSYSLALFAPLA